jgi:hypothetical protein
MTNAKAKALMMQATIMIGLFHSSENRNIRKNHQSEGFVTSTPHYGLIEYLPLFFIYFAWLNTRQQCQPNHICLNNREIPIGR